MPHPVNNTQDVTETADIVVGKMPASDFPSQVPASPEDAENVNRWDEQRKAQKEGTRTHVTMLLLKMFGCLLMGNFFLTAAAAFAPNADRAFIEKAWVFRI